MTPFDRAAHCRRIAAAGGRRTVELHGIAHMSAIGKLGFRAAVDLGWGLELARKLGASYELKFGRPLTLTSACQRKAQIRAEARRFYGGSLCDRCAGGPGQVHHLHINGGDPNQGGLIRVLCGDCHRAEHRRQRRDHLRRAQ